MRAMSLISSLVLLGCAAKPPPKKVKMKRGPPPLRITAELDRRFVKAQAPGEIIARLRVTTRPDLEFPRSPINLGLVVDSSGSMRGAAIEHARKAALAMMEVLQPGDRISLVVFNSESKVLVPQTVVDGPARARITAQIEKMTAWGTTDMTGGLAKGIAQVTRARRPGSVNRIVLLSDGNPNDPRPIVSQARYAQRQSITITALGLGLDYNETLLGAVARASGGSFHFIKDPARVARVFRDEVVGMRKVVAQHLSLRIMPGPGITIRRIYGRAVRRSGRYVHVPLGVMRAGERRDVIVRLSVPPRRAGATIEVLDGLLTYYARPPRGRSYYAHRSIFLAAAATIEPDKLATARNRDFDLSIARAEAAQATVDAIALARARRLKDALARLDQGLVAARLAAKKFKDGELETQVAEMVKLRAALPSLVPKIRPASLRMHREVAPAPADSPMRIRKAHSGATNILSR